MPSKPSRAALPEAEAEAFGAGPDADDPLPEAPAVDSLPAETTGASAAPASPGAPRPLLRVLKKYPNRRLYDTQLSTYITLADVKGMVMKAERFEVRDAKTGEDLTRSILLQIILEEETGGMPLFSATMLAQLIRFHGHAMQGVMGSYLEKNLQTFTDIQSRLAEQSAGLYDPASQNPELWSQFLNAQAPVVQGVMGTYLEQSRAMFVQMQEQMAKQAGALFTGIPRMPGLVPPKR